MKPPSESFLFGRIEEDLNTGHKGDLAMLDKILK